MLLVIECLPDSRTKGAWVLITCSPAQKCQSRDELNHWEQCSRARVSSLAVDDVVERIEEWSLAITASMVLRNVKVIVISGHSH